MSNNEKDERVPVSIDPRFLKLMESQLQNWHEDLLAQLKLKRRKSSSNASDSRLSRRSSEEHLAGFTRTRPIDLNKTAVRLLLSLMSLVITSCESAFHSSDINRTKISIRHAKRSYASALRYAGRISFSVTDVQAFEVRTVKLENIISELERRWYRAQSSNHDGGGLEEGRLSA